MTVVLRVRVAGERPSGAASVARVTGPRKNPETAGGEPPGSARLDGQGNREGGPASRPALDRDGPAVGFHDPLRNGQAQTYARAPAAAATRLVRAPEPVEDVGEISRRDAHAGVSH